MVAELQEITRFLKRFRPFDSLPAEALEEISGAVEVAYHRRGEEVLRYGEAIQDLYVVRSGSVETYRRNGELYNRLSEGGIFGQMGLLMNRRVRFPVKALEDLLVYCIPVDIFNRFCDEYEPFADYFDTDDAARLKQAVSAESSGNDLLSQTVQSLVVREPVTMGVGHSVQEAARLMNDEAISAVLVMEGNDLIGLLADQDFRQKVVADGLSADTPIRDVMVRDPVCIDGRETLFEAMLLFANHQQKQLPVLQDDRVIGVISVADLVRSESRSSLLLVKSIRAQTSLEGLVVLSKQVPEAFVRLVHEDASSLMIGAAMSVIGRSFKQALIRLAEEKLGPAPVAYCYLALGSMAREEQVLVTDQDNALILSDDFVAAQHDAYFAELGKFVSEGLDACGYPYCTGDVMASNPKWRKTRAQWAETFRQWMQKPDPQALLDSSIFFDLDGVAGQVSWARDLQKLIATEAAAHPPFLAAMAQNARRRTPPLGFFRGFVMEQSGAQKNTINLKRRGTAPLTDLIRVHALACGSLAQNSFRRLEDIASKKTLQEGKPRDLADALEYVSMVRIRHQARALEAGQEADNSLDPKQLSGFERQNLKEAFHVIESAQNYLKFAYHVAGRVT